MQKLHKKQYNDFNIISSECFVASLSFLHVLIIDTHTHTHLNNNSIYLADFYIIYLYYILLYDLLLHAIIYCIFRFLFSFNFKLSFSHFVICFCYF